MTRVVANRWFGLIPAVISRLRHVGVGRTAGSLAFTTLLGLVPLFAVAFSVVAGYPMFQSWLDALETMLLKYALPGRGSLVRTYVMEFTGKAANLKGIGIAFVVVTAVLLVAQVEREINEIWGVRARRSVLRRLLVYGFGLTAGPILIGAAVYFTSWLIDTSLAAVPDASHAANLLAKPIELIVMASVLTAVFALVPARSVPWKYAVVGGIAAALAFESAKYGFLLYIRHVPTYEVLYGALAALPLFLLWIYFSWLIVLMGAAITAALTAGPAGRRKSDR